MKKSIIRCSFLIALFTCIPLQAQSLNGQWKIIEGVMAGQTVPSDTLAAMSLNLNRKTFEAKSGSANSSGTLTNNPHSTPSQLVFQINQGADSGREIKAIYQHIGGNMQIAFSQTGEFPKDFESNSDNKNLLLTYNSSAPAVPEKKYRDLTIEAAGAGSGG